MRKLFVWMMLLSLVYIEARVTTMPLVIVALVLLFIKEQKAWVLYAGFISGLLFDFLAIRSLGETSLFYLLFLFLILLYKKKFEIKTHQFVGIAAFSGSFLFLWIFGYHSILIQSVVVSILALVLFLIQSRW